MKVFKEISILDFVAWSGAVSTRDKIINEGKALAFDNYIEECYPDGLSETELNDILWFDSNMIFEYLGIDNEE